MYNKTVIRLINVFLVISLVGLNVGRLCAQRGGTIGNGTTINPANKQPSFPHKTNIRATRSDISSDLIVVYFPSDPSFHRLIGIGPDILMQALKEFQETGNAHPLGKDAFAKVIKSDAQKQLLLGMLDTKGTSAKSWDGDSEILITEQSWNKAVIIDQYGTVNDGFELYENQHGSLQHRLTSSFYRYKLAPDAFKELHHLMQMLFLVKQPSLPAAPA